MHEKKKPRELFDEKKGLDQSFRFYEMRSRKDNAKRRKTIHQSRK